MAGYFYAFADPAAASAAGALDAAQAPTVPEALILRETGVAIVGAVYDLATGDVLTPAVLSAPFVILSPEIIPGCSSALIEPPGHQGFA